jgi:diacylglycerol kinase family enzyme
VRLLPAALRGTFLKHPKAHLERASEVEIELKEHVPAHVDGELLTPTRSFCVRVLPGALRVLSP